MYRVNELTQTLVDALTIERLKLRNAGKLSDTDGTELWNSRDHR